MKKCPDRSVLERMARGELSNDELPNIEAHVEVCDGCARRLAESEGGAELLAQIGELEASREAIAPALMKLREKHSEISTTLFGSQGEKS